MIAWLKKAFGGGRMQHQGRSFFLGNNQLARTSFDYRKAIGDNLDSSVVTAPVQWVQRAVLEARLIVQKVDTDGAESALPSHPMLALAARPNEYYDGKSLLMATILSFLIDGNAYWAKVRNGNGRVVELWYVPHWLISPFWENSSDNFIEYYRYSPGGSSDWEKLAIADIVHFRYGINPRNVRRGLSPIDGAIREIFMDLESSNFVATLLRNMGVPGAIISPSGSAMPTPEDVEATKRWFGASFGGDRRGSTLVMGAPTKVEQYGFNPQQMNMSEARDIAEERVCSSLGIPSAVVGFGSGMQQTKVGATMTELRKEAWHGGVLPVIKMLAGELSRSLLPEFGRSDSERVAWDTSDVPALQTDEAAESLRWSGLVSAGIATVAEAREAAGLPFDDSHRFFFHPFSAIPVPEGTSLDALAAGVEEPAPSVSQGGDDGDADKALYSEMKARATRAQYQRALRFLRRTERGQARLHEDFQKELLKFFNDLGDESAKIAAPVLRENPDTIVDEIIVDILISRIEFTQADSRWIKIYAKHYNSVVRTTISASQDMGLGLSTNAADGVARRLVETGGRRAGLVDVQGQTRKALFHAMAEGRALGEGADALAKRIAKFVTHGPFFQSIEYRSRLIARTETKYAQNVSTISVAAHNNVNKFVTFDGRFGEPRSLPDHIARDGKIVSLDEAMELSEKEHPNGTLSFAPYFGE